MTHQAPLMLSVSGLRGIVGQSLTAEVAAQYGQALGSWFAQEGGIGCTLVLGRDSRSSGQILSSAVTTGLTAAGCNVIDLGIVSTPAVGVAVKQQKATGGIVLTASHNPAPWNGIKALSSLGGAPAAEQAQEIIRRFKENDFQLQDAAYTGRVYTQDNGCAQHIIQVLKYIDVELVRSAKFTAVVDATHGAGGAEAQQLLEALGVQVIGHYMEPTGLFPHLPEPTEENLTELASHVANTPAADIGFALDPDADRLAMIDETGHYIGEEYTLALAALASMAEGSTCVVNLSSSRMVDDVAQAVNGSIVRTCVGEANVASGMREHRTNIGGEGSGGVIFAPLSYVRDSFYGMALVLEYLAKNRLSLSQAVAKIPKYAMLKQKVNATPELIDRISKILPAAFPEAQSDTRDGVRLDWRDRWVHVRASNTEPIVRIMAEAPAKQDALQICQQIKQALSL